MQLSTPKQVQTQETKQKIYKAASSILKKKGFTSHIETLEFLQALRFHVIPHTRCATADEALRRIAGIGETRDGFAFDIDGAVVKLDSLPQRAQLGSTAKFPRWAPRSVPLQFWARSASVEQS